MQRFASLQRSLLSVHHDIANDDRRSAALPTQLERTNDTANRSGSIRYRRHG
jgi:hypothetical protein